MIADLIEYPSLERSLNNLPAEELNKHVEEIVKSRHQNIKTIKSTLELVFKWAKNDPKTRFQFLSLILRNIPLQKLRREFLTSTILSQNILSESHPCSRFLVKALTKITSTPERCSKRLKSFNSSHVFCFGGLSENNQDLCSVSHMNTFTGKWGTCSSMSAEKILFSGAVIGPKVYLCGGNSHDGILDTMEVFDSRCGCWRGLRPMPEPGWEMASAAHGGYIYVTGGMNRAYDWLQSVNRYHVRDNRWEPVMSMHECRIGHQLVELNGCLYAIGGRATNTVERYDPYNGRWSMVASMEYQHCLFGATAHRGKIYVCSDQGFEVYSPKDNSWQTLIPLNHYLGRSLVSMEVENKLLAIGGGHMNKGGTDSVFCYDLFTAQWSQMESMTVSRQYHCSFVVG